MSAGLELAWFASSLVSAYWNGAATYYRGIVRALAARGHRITFYEPDAFDRQLHRDLDDPPWARVVVYPPTEDAALAMVERAHRRSRDKASGVGVHDALLERAVLELQGPRTAVAFWDVDAPATLDRMAADPDDPFPALIPRYDLIFTYGGGAPVTRAYERLGARRCVPIYNALDPTTHFPVPPDPRFSAVLGFLGNRLPDRERRVDEFFLGAAARLPRHPCLLGGAGWEGKALPPNVRSLPVGSRVEGGVERPRAVGEYLIDRMIRGGATKICIVIAPTKGDIVAYFGGAVGDAHLAYVVQPTPAGLCDAVFQALPLIADDEPVIVGLPDTIWYPEDALLHLPDDRLSFLCFPVDDPAPFDAVESDPSGRVRAIRVKDPAATSRWVWGAFKLPGRILRELAALWREPGRGDVYIGTLVNAWLARGGDARAVHAGEAYVDVGTLHGWRDAVHLLERR